MRGMLSEKLKISRSPETGRRIENPSEGITLQIKKKAELAGSLSAYIYLIKDAQLNNKYGSMHSFLSNIRKMLMMTESHTALFVAPSAVGRHI